MNHVTLAIEDLGRIAQTLAEALRLDAQRVTLAAGPLGTPAHVRTEEDPRGEIEIDAALLDQFGDDDAVCWVLLAHEVGHIYWEQRQDLATACEGFHWEDSADFTAGQLTAACGRDPKDARDALTRVLAAYDGLASSRFYRGISDRQTVFLNGYVDWAK